MKILAPVKHDSGNCRLYVEDQDKRKYVILDQGLTFEMNGMTRFDLHTHSRDGEPCSPIKTDWILKQGILGTVFEYGLSHLIIDDWNCSQDGELPNLSLFSNLEVSAVYDHGNGEESDCRVIVGVSSVEKTLEEALGFIPDAEKVFFTIYGRYIPTEEYEGAEAFHDVKTLEEAKKIVNYLTMQHSFLTNTLFV
jgi:hypothetical protein